MLRTSLPVLRGQDCVSTRRLPERRRQHIPVGAAGPGVDYGADPPIILLTARVHEAEKILGLDAGADDYVTKPFSLRELRARIRAQLRRALPETAGEYRFGDCEIDFDRAELKRSGRRVEITAQELRLLAALVRNRGRVLSRDQLIEAAWGRGIAITERAVDSHIFNLRKKIEPVACPNVYGFRPNKGPT